MAITPISGIFRKKILRDSSIKRASKTYGEWLRDGRQVRKGEKCVEAPTDYQDAKFSYSQTVWVGKKYKVVDLSREDEDLLFDMRNIVEQFISVANENGEETIAEIYSSMLDELEEEIDRR